MKKIVSSIPRRDFLKTASSVVFSAPLLVSSNVLAFSANDRVSIGCIGAGGRGSDKIRAFIRETDAQILAVCDVFEEKRNVAKQLVEERYVEKHGKGTFKGCTAYKDFEDVLARDDIDAVAICTPDHWHVPIGIAAAKAGKDMLIEKPLSHTLLEGRFLSRAIEKYKRVFQHGTQQRCDEKFRHACELVRNHYIGELQAIEVGSPFSSMHENQPEMDVPAGFDYIKWLGPARKKPYTEDRCRTPYWYFISDYTLGYVSGWGVHHVDIAQWGNNTDSSGPAEIEGEGEFPKEGLCDTATAWDVELTYANGVKMRFADNVKNANRAFSSKARKAGFM